MKAAAHLLVLFAAACGGDDGGADASADASPDRVEDTREDTEPAGDPAVELGTGSASYVALADRGEQLELIAGPQGGWHVDVAATLRNVDPDDVILSYTFTLDGEDSPISMPTQIQLRSDRVIRISGSFVRLGDLLVMDIIDPSEVADMDGVVRVSVLIDGEEVASDESEVLIIDDEA